MLEELTNLLILILLFGGISVSKFHLFGPVYLFDALFVCVFCFALVVRENSKSYKFIEILFFVALFYLSISGKQNDIHLAAIDQTNDVPVILDPARLFGQAR